MAGQKNTLDQLKQFWASRTGKQKGLLLGGAGFTALLLVLFVRLIGTPDYKPLFTGLELADAQALAAKLDAQGIPHQTSADGKTISVPSDKLDAARIQSSSDGAPHSGRMGFELFDKMSWGQTEFDQKVAYQRAMEGELERSIQTLSDVERARVHLVMATDSVFLDRQRGAKASVILKLRRGSLSKASALAIARLVSGAVDELKPEDVAMVDADSERSLGIGQNGADGADGGSGDLSSRLISTLEPVVGSGKIRASVNVAYDQESREENEEKYDPTVSAVLSEQKSEDSAGGSAVPGGVPGTASNIPSDKQPKPSNTLQNQNSKTESAQYGVNKTMVHTVSPAGQVQRITAAILVDDAIVKSVEKGKTTYSKRKRTPDELNQIKQLAQAVIGYDEKRGDSITVQNLSFDADAADLEVPAVGWSEKVQKSVTQYSSFLRPVSLLALFVLAYLFLVRPLQKSALSVEQLSAAREPHLAPGELDTLPVPKGELGSGAARATQLKEHTAELIRQKPLHTARAVQSWLREEPS
jgi:flagellar M-ring protein FliF